MKRKSRACSTGHGTGDGPNPFGFMGGASLRAILVRDKLRRVIKKYCRRYDKIVKPRSAWSFEDRRKFVLALLDGEPEAMKRAGYVLRREVSVEG
jgi:hypothetical protein